MAAAGVGTHPRSRLSEIGFVSGVRMSLSKTHLSLLLLLLVGLSMAASQKEDGQRTRRDSKAECVLKHEYWDGNQCKSCLCASGEQSTAEFCGYGVIAGEPGCEPCPDDTYRNGTDISIHCHPCSVCDPDANVTSNCTKIQDTLCACKEGFVMNDTHCVSCRDHPNAEGCSSVVATANPPEPFPESRPEPSPEPCPEPSPEPSSEIPEGFSCAAWKAGVGLACFFLPVIGVAVGICIERKRARQQRRKRQEAQRKSRRRIEMKEQSNGTSHGVDAHAGAGDDHDAEHPPTENRVSAANGEANGLLEANGGGNELNAE